MGIYYGQLNVKMHRRKDGVYAFKGNVEQWENPTETIEVDGNTFTRQLPRITTVLDCKDAVGNDLRIDEIEFEAAGVTIKIEDCKCYNTSFAQWTRYHLSQNPDVARLQLIKELEILPKEILNIYTVNNNRRDTNYPQLPSRGYWIKDKMNYYYKNRCTEDFFRMLLKNELTFELFDYGFGNSVYYDTTYQTFIDNLLNLEDEIFMYLNELGFKVSKKKDKIANGLIIMDALIKAKKWAKSNNIKL
jgi:hypothetical protein